MTARRDARHCVNAGNAKVDLTEVRMRFVPVLGEFITWRGFPAGRHFQRIRGFIADANSAISIGQASRSRRISHGESRL
jgi:hypothetical protein